MASATHTLLLLLPLSMLLLLLSITADARPGRHFHPCKTILFISSSSSYYNHHHLDHNHNPNLPLPNPSSSNGPHQFLTFFFFTDNIQQFNPQPSLPRRIIDPIEKPQTPLDLYSSSMDIMSVVGALLFGVGCGALTASTMYLIWSLFSPNRFEFADSDDEYDEEEDVDDVSPKNMGYVAVPAAKEVWMIDQEGLLSKFPRGTLYKVDDNINQEG
ncbi:hypothetical protein LguiB_018872 [Lonicera macranthoides]